MKASTAITALGAIGVAACSQAPAKVDTAAIEKQIRANEDKWNVAYNTHDAAGLASNYANDAALANPGSPLVTGLDAIRKQTAAFAADPSLKVQFAADRILVGAAGDIASSRGHYTLTMTDPATKKPVEGSGSYLTVYKKQTDGSWKAVEDFITPGPETVAAK